MSDIDITNGSLAGSQRRLGHVFISYKSQQDGEASRLQQFIEGEGYPCWRAPGSLHKRGTQDYSNDIFKAIRESNCLLFVLSDAALGSDWVQREVNYALNTCHKPVIPFVVDRIPTAKKESNGVYISLQLEKQILNEDLSWKMDVILPYLEKAFGDDRHSAEVQQGKKEPELRGCSQAEWTLWSKTAEFHQARLKELEKMDILRPGPVDLTPEAREMGFRFSANEVADALIKILTTIPHDAKEWQKRQNTSIQRQAAKDIAKLTYDYGGRFSPFIYSWVQPFAEAGIPWANFVMHSKYYLANDVLTTGNDDDSCAKSFPYLQKAVLDGDNPWAFLRMGECCQWGIGCEVSGGQARFWYERAKQLDCPEALFCLARLYKFAPAGIRKDLPMAKDLAEKGAQAGNAKAYWLLGDLYLEQYYVDFEDHLKKEAEKYYIRSYDLGWPRALCDLGWFRFSDEEYQYEEDRFKDFQHLCRTMKRAGIRGANNLLARKALYNEHIDAASTFALAGFRSNDWDATDTYAGLLVWEECKELASRPPVAWNPVFDWIATKLSESALMVLAPFISFLRDKEVKAPEEWNWNNNGDEEPKTPFWKAMTEGEEPVSTNKRQNLEPNAEFLSVLWNLPISDENSDFAVVKDIWELVRLLDWELETAKILGKGAVDVFPPEFFDDSPARQKRILEILLLRMDNIPNAPTFYQQMKLKHAECEKRNDYPLATVKEDLARLRKELHEGRVSDDEAQTPLRIAVRLGDIERLVSPPVFAASMTFCRKAFDFCGGSGYASHFAHLFLALNARHFDQNRNEGMLFGVRDILYKGILLGDPSCVPLYLELCLLGLRVGKSRLESDFSLIEKIEPYLFELAEDESCSAKTMAEVAFAMGKIYEDKNLVHMARVESWGHVSLYDPTKAFIWFDIAEKRAEAAGVDMIEKLARAKLTPLRETLVGLAEKIRESSEPDKNEARLAKPRSGKEKAIQDLSERVPPELDAMAFKHVALEGQVIDLVVSSDEVAVLFAVYPEEEDYVACPREDGDELADPGMPNAVFPTKLEALEKQRESLQKMELDAKIHLAIIASTKTLESMRRVWKNELEEKEVGLVEYCDFEDYQRKFLPLFEESKADVEGEDASSEETNEEDVDK